MLKDLIKLANELDSNGLVKQADLLDKIINKKALWDHYHGQPEDMTSNYSSREMFIIRDLIRDQKFDKGYLQELYNKA